MNLTTSCLWKEHVRLLLLFREHPYNPKQSQWSRKTKKCLDRVWFAIYLVGESWCSLGEMEGENNKDCNGAVSVLIFGVLGSRSWRWRVDWTCCCMGGSRALLILDLQETLVPPRKGSLELDLQPFKPHVRDMS